MKPHDESLPPEGFSFLSTHIPPYIYRLCTSYQQLRISTGFYLFLKIPFPPIANIGCVCYNRVMLSTKKRDLSTDCDINVDKIHFYYAQISTEAQ